MVCARYPVRMLNVEMKLQTYWNVKTLFFLLLCFVFPSSINTGDKQMIGTFVAHGQTTLTIFTIFLWHVKLDDEKWMRDCRTRGIAILLYSDSICLLNCPKLSWNLCCLFVFTFFFLVSTTTSRAPPSCYQQSWYQMAD